MNDHSLVNSLDGHRKAVSLRYRTSRRVNFASAQNGVAIIKGITVENRTGETLKDVRITLQTVPAVIREKTWVIDRIGPGSRHSVQKHHLSTPLHTERLAGLNQAETGELQFRLEAQGLQPIVEKCQIELLAQDEWGGVGDMAQILAAFVSPNEPAVAHVLKDAGRLLEREGHSSSMDGYQSSDPGRAYLLAGAIWSAMTGLGLTYAEPPASFERKGQKIRGPGRITSEGLATCLDSTLFLAAAYEAAGLNPVVLFSHGHVWVGFWVIKRDFGHVTEPDVVAVRKAMQSREFIPVETTLLTRRPAIGFEEASDHGRRRLLEERDPEFVIAVDIVRSRAAQVRPLASHRVVDSSESGAVDETAPAPLPQIPDFSGLPGSLHKDVPRTPQNRISRWQCNLLDLSRRNSLLSYRDTKQTLPLCCPSIANFEHKLADGKSFQGFSLNDNSPIDKQALPREEVRRIEEEVIRNAFDHQQFVVPLTGKEMEKRLQNLYRQAKRDMQEGGTNTLFLAVGFLHYQKEKDTHSYRAPLVLIPAVLERQSARSPFLLQRCEEGGVRINLTLLEFLKRDFELDIREMEQELPSNQHGINIKRIFEVMRQKVRDMAGFEVVEELALSTFSFAKYLMWKDLVERSDKLRHNKLVKRLIDGPEETNGEMTHGPIIEPENIDHHYSPQDILTPLPADSSQLAAVLAASEGHDFILIGPPGTGKSQTITNIIAQCLGSGKTVLFVAEKAAALDVVQRRLEKTGLGNAVLELHSNKAERKSVLRQLKRGWERVQEATEEQWIDITAKLKLSRDQLNAYVEALHGKGLQGFSVFDAIATVASVKPPFMVSFSSKDAHDQQSYKRLVDLAADLGRKHAAVRTSPPLRLICCETWSLQWEREVLRTVIPSLQAALKDLRRTEQNLAHELGICSDPILEAGHRKRLKALAPRLERSALSLSLVPDLPPDRLHELAQSLAMDVKYLAMAQAATVATYSLDKISDMPLNQLMDRWQEAQRAIWPLSICMKRKVRRDLQVYADKGVVDPAADFEALLKMRRHDTAIRKCPLTPVVEAAGADCLTNVVHQTTELRAALTALRSDVEDSVRFASASSMLASVTAGTVQDALQAYLAAEEAVDNKTREFTERGGVFPVGSSVKEFEADLAMVRDAQPYLADWVKWLEKKKEGCAAGLGPLVEALENGHIQQDAAEAFKEAYADWWLPLAMDAHQSLRGFTRQDHEEVIKTFGKLDHDAAQWAPVEVMRHIAHSLPPRDRVPKRSELRILHHQLGLRRPSLSTRQLLEKLPTTFEKLVPCVLMSPLSIAQYLPARTVFDLVIFDEASQITTWDAIGAIARGRQTIIVGDPKQLPPTNFFGRADDDNEDLPDLERDMPSILDDVRSTGLPCRYLKWHYRSHDETLIAFSNHFYYDNKLVTFPSPATGSDAIKFNQVSGAYARGGGRVNQEEAKAIAEMVRERLQAWLAVPEDQRQTLGVITFNAEQRSLIEDLIDGIRRQDNTLEWFFADEREKPVIVKNLENMQGDERDVMLFSVTFGPDLNGKLTMNFGALNNEGGEKRLNVAITRARRELHIFSSIRAEDIDLNRTRAVGVKYLKTFLDYAERGNVALPERDEGSLGPAESLFEEAVAKTLRGKGWEVRTQIGSSGFRVDLGIVHPNYAGRYLAGVECDGATYHASATARDRDKARQAVLEGLGWTIFRVWSTDWFRNPAHVTDQLHEKLEQLLQQSCSC